MSLPAATRLPANIPLPRRHAAAIGASVFLHVALLIGIIALRPALEPGVGASPRYVEIAIVDGHDAFESGATAPERAADSDGAPPDVGAPAAEPTGSGNGAAPGSPAAATARADETGASPAADPAAEAPVDAATGQPNPAPTRQADATTDGGDQLVASAVETSAPTAVRHEAEDPSTTIETAVTVADSAATDNAATDDAANDHTATDNKSQFARVPQPPPSAAEQRQARTAPTASSAAPQVPIPESESRLLTAEIESWSRRFAALGDATGAARWEGDGGVYTATVAFAPGADSSSYDAAVVTITTERDGRTLATRVPLTRLGFSHYAQFIDRWDPQVQIHDDEIDGRFHSNSEIYIGRSGGVQPKFLGRVTTARTINTSQSERSVHRDQVFLGGLETRVGRIPLPAHIGLFAADEPDADHILRLAGDTRLRFDGETYEWSQVLSRRERREQTGEDSPDGGRGRIPRDAPFFVVAGPDASVHVSGTVTGRVLIYTPENIIVEGALVYAEPPVGAKHDTGDGADGRSSTDYLGLVADRNVEIANDDVTGPGDLEIDAAIYARQRFVVRGYRTKHAGELRIVGSLTAGSVTATEPRYSTKLVYDRRLEKTRPPRFPVTDRYEIGDWDGSWTLIGADGLEADAALADTTGVPPVGADR